MTLKHPTMKRTTTEELCRLLAAIAMGVTTVTAADTWSVRLLTRFSRVERHAGTRLNTRTASPLYPSVAASTRASGESSSAIENGVEWNWATRLRSSRLSLQTLSSRPNPPPNQVSRSPSSTSWRTTRPREAPGESRMAISFRRARPRASSRLARLRLAIRETRVRQSELAVCQGTF